MNLQTLREQTAGFIGDPSITRHTSADYTTALNRAQEQFVMESKALWKDVTWTTVSGTAAYAFSAASTDISSLFLWEDWVTYDGSELAPISRHELQRLTPGNDWTDDAGAPTHFVIDPEEAQKKIRLYPITQEAKTLSMRCYVLPTALSGDSDVPLNSSTLLSQFHISICAYAAWLLLLKEETTPGIVEKRRELLSIYSNGRDLAIDTFKNTMSMGINVKGSRIWR